MAKDFAYDGVILSTFDTHIDEVAHIRTQPTENVILKRNAELRKNPGVIMDLGAKSSEGTCSN